MPSIFDNIRFINENNESNPLEYIYSESGLVKDCSIFVTEEMISECSNNIDLIRQQALLEGAKFDLMLNNYVNEGKDYKGLKKELKAIMKANKMSDEELKTGKKGILHSCKRAVQIILDLISVSLVGGAVGWGISSLILIPSAFLIPVLRFVLAFITSRLFRLAADAVEFDAIKKDAKKIVSDLRSNAKKSKDKSTSKKLNREADKLEFTIEKYSKGKK